MRTAVSGLRAWMVQRISAVYMLVFIVYLLGHFIVDPPRSHTDWAGWVLSTGVSIAFLVFFAALLAHAWVGLRDVIMDYVHPVALRVTVLALLACGLLATAAWVASILLQ